ncbi:hypothetical protein [Aquimarina sp. 2201CG5-10]|uniref:hypothetical protein n=1 Tax=Aquimarina callyspongiae TaxID=3098150 RepID=UPI002AB5D2B0|nr:hypothetical protein [Aquimarina sp. 2201CG5-10]MDY8136283.1 hypothetical protein [Aquimarina sp. 2201CG5-10]
MSKDFRTIQVTKSDLEEALKNNTFWSKKASFIPFTKSKAQWLLDNPRMDKSDVCAVIGYEGDEMVAFVYQVPDWIKTSQGNKKVYWCRRWWVADRYKNSVLATFVMNEAVTAVDNQVLIKFLGKEVEEFYTKQPYTNFSERIRYFILFSVDADLLVSKIKLFRFFRYPIKTLDVWSKKIVQIFNNLKLKKFTKNLVYEYITKIDEPTWQFIEEACKNDCIIKDATYISWQIRNDQYTQTPIENRYPFKCLIAGASYRIYSTSFKVLLDNKIIGFISAIVRGNEFDIKYFIASDGHYDICIAALIENFNRSGANTIHTENETLGKKIVKQYTSIYTDKRKLNALAHNDIDFDFKQVTVYDQDGHFA